MSERFPHNIDQDSPEFLREGIKVLDLELTAANKRIADLEQVLAEAVSAMDSMRNWLVGSPGEDDYSEMDLRAMEAEAMHLLNQSLARCRELLEVK